MDSKAIMFSSFLKNCMIFLNEKKYNVNILINISIYVQQDKNHRDLKQQGCSKGVLILTFKIPFQNSF